METGKVEVYQIVASFWDKEVIRHPNGWGRKFIAHWHHVEDINGNILCTGKAKCVYSAIIAQLRPRWDARFIITLKRPATLYENFLNFEYPIEFKGINNDIHMVYSYKLKKLVKC